MSGSEIMFTVMGVVLIGVIILGIDDIIDIIENFVEGINYLMDSRYKIRKLGYHSTRKCGLDDDVKEYLLRRNVMFIEECDCFDEEDFDHEMYDVYLKYRDYCTQNEVSFQKVTTVSDMTVSDSILSWLMKCGVYTEVQLARSVSLSPAPDFPVDEFLKDEDRNIRKHIDYMWYIDKDLTVRMNEIAESQMAKGNFSIKHVDSEEDVLVRVFIDFEQENDDVMEYRNILERMDRKLSLVSEVKYGEKPGKDEVCADLCWWIYGEGEKDSLKININCYLGINLDVWYFSVFFEGCTRTDMCRALLGFYRIKNGRNFLLDFHGMIRDDLADMMRMIIYEDKNG